MTGRRYAVVGGGMSGLAAAYHLEQAGHQVDLFERDARLGGRCGPDLLGDRPIMVGGKNIGRRYHEVRAFLAAAGADRYEPFGINSSQVIDDKLVTLDNPGLLGKIAHLFRAGSVADAVKTINFGARILADERNRYLDSAFFARTAAEDGPVSDYFGAEFTRNVLRPITVRLNAAEPEEAFLGAFGVSLGMVMDRYDQLVDGIQPALAWLEGRVGVRLGAEVTGLVVRDGQVRGLQVAENDRPPVEYEYDGVVLATTARVAAPLLAPHDPELGTLLAGVRYFPSTVAVVRYDQPLFNPTVRSVAFDSGPCSAAGVYGVNDLDIVRYTFSGRTARPAPDAPQLAAWIDAAEQRVRTLLHPGPAVRVESTTRTWEAAHCAYVPHHSRFLALVRTALTRTTGLRLAGDYLAGAQLEACFRSGREAAHQLSAEPAPEGQHARR
ncbi:FAD-dependent oxidoreductase [Nocardia sp. NPDC050712]|uniref:protoporphyrinogen/coproporphyrinogen oxidase n=1 Tax=Nocardia sp. NPDC050712 TaxID=3155518 RepID=UPI0033DA99DD